MKLVQFSLEVVDGKIYNKEGVKLIDFTAYAGRHRGTAEVVIVPDPANCSRYYIILAGRDHYPDQHTNTMSNKLPYYATIDTSKPNLFHPNILGYVAPTMLNNSYFKCIIGH